MSTSPRVSIVMGTYNRAGLLGRAIEALRRQTFTDWELIVADDASVDDTPATIRAWAEREPRIVSLRNEVNEGISRNYNNALRAARGEFVAMLDDDDVWCVDDKLERQVAFLENHPDHVGCGGGLIVINPQAEELDRYLKPETDEQIRRSMLFSNPMANSTTLFRREAGRQVGWYDASMRYSGDRDFWMKLALIGKLHNFQEYLGYYTIGTNNTSIAHIKPHLKASLALTSRYRKSYPHYGQALLLNYAQYWYAFLPPGVRRSTHLSAVRFKRAVSGAWGVIPRAAVLTISPTKPSAR
jgi:glycosyltransferase involved in cell wall biosynthesis